MGSNTCERKYEVVGMAMRKPPDRGTGSVSPKGCSRARLPVGTHPHLVEMAMTLSHGPAQLWARATLSRV